MYNKKAIDLMQIFDQFSYTKAVSFSAYSQHIHGIEESLSHKLSIG